jgi:hypothetical protein
VKFKIGDRVVVRKVPRSQGTIEDSYEIGYIVYGVKHDSTNAICYYKGVNLRKIK